MQERRHQVLIISGSTTTIVLMAFMSCREIIPQLTEFFIQKSPTPEPLAIMDHILLNTIKVYMGFIIGLILILGDGKIGGQWYHHAILVVSVITTGNLLLVNV